MQRVVLVSVRTSVGIHFRIALVGLSELLSEGSPFFFDFASPFSCLSLEALGISSSPLGLRLGFNRCGFVLPQVGKLLFHVAPHRLSPRMLPSLPPTLAERHQHPDDDKRDNDDGGPHPDIHVLQGLHT